MRSLRSAHTLLAAGVAAAAFVLPAAALAQAAPRAPAAPAPPSSSTPPTRPPPDLPPPPPPPWQPGAAPATAEAPTIAEPLPAGGAPAAPQVAAPIDPAAAAAMERRIAVLEQRLVETRRQIEEHERARESHDEMDKLRWLRRFNVSGYVQPQLVWQWFDANASPNPQSAVQGPNPTLGANSVIAKSDGTTNNADFFRLRRARLKTEFSPSESARLVFEIDPTPAGGVWNGVGTIMREVEAVGIVHWGALGATTELAAGIFKVPFGYEVLQSDADRPFIERSWMEQNLFTGEFDTGIRAYTHLMQHRLTVQAAVVNGIVQGEKTFAIVPDLNHGKDLVGRVAYNFGSITLGASGYYGQGQIVDATLLRFKQFPRWAVNGEIDGRYVFFRTLGETRFFAEVTRAQNLDRGTRYGALALPSFPADIVNANVNDLDEVGYFLRVEQDLGQYVTLGLRSDYYSPNSAQSDNGRDTESVVGVVHFTRSLQWMAELDVANDKVHAPGESPQAKQIVTLSNVLQARF